MAAPLPNSRLPGTRSTQSVRDAGQLDFFRSLWTRVAGSRSGSDPALPPLTASSPGEVLSLPAGDVRVFYVRHPRARRYRLVFRRDGSARCTIPRRGTLAEARRFVSENEAWLTDVVRRHQQSPRGPGPLREGGMVPFAGQGLPLLRMEIVPTASAEEDEEGEGLWFRVGPVQFFASLASASGDLRPAVEQAMRRYATESLAARVEQLAAEHKLGDRVRRVSVRSQRTRWGSCSRRGVISLNWRLVQVPDSVRDYVIVHELAHLLHMNHSDRFWGEVERLSPNYQASEAWLREHGRLFL